MLHEALLALSGHPSPLFGVSLQDNTALDEFPYVTDSERFLLQSLGRLTHLHRQLKKQLQSICQEHRSVIVRATAHAIHHEHLGRFQQRILDIEERILKRDPTLVGAYDVVPLSAVVVEFGDWQRRMAWYWEMAQVMLPGDGPETHMADKERSMCSGAALMDRLRAETRTGHVDIESAAVELCAVAETAWLKQLGSWIVYGKLPMFGLDDFFVKDRDNAGTGLTRDKTLLPAFVSHSTAHAIFTLGRSLNQLTDLRRKSQGRVDSAPSADAFDEDALRKVHLSELSSLPLPLTPASFTNAISTIQASLSRNVLQHLLPLKLTSKVISCLQQYFLLGRSEFAVALIDEAEKHLSLREQDKKQSFVPDPNKILQGLSVRDAELGQIIRQTWRNMTIVGHIDEETISFAQSHISLIRAVEHLPRPSTSDGTSNDLTQISLIAFDDLMLPVASRLHFRIEAPLNLFLTDRDVTAYSKINTYLLSIRRGCHKLCDLWKHASARKAGNAEAATDKSISREQTVALRKVWATCSAANLLLSETAAFFEGEVIRGSCKHFNQWLMASELDPSIHNRLSTAASKESSIETQRDPETLAAGHRVFLSSLIYALLLTDVAYTKELRSLLGNVDSLIGLFNRQLNLQQKLKQERTEAGTESVYTREECTRISLELDRARKRVDSDLKGVVNRLRQLDAERIGSLRYLQTDLERQGSFEAWKVGGIDRLLMKLEYGRMVVLVSDALIS